MANNNEGRRFRVGSIGDKPVILVMAGLSMVSTVSYIVEDYSTT
jgi:hypothetical protein